jgi:hypothetical protein
LDYKFRVFYVFIYKKNIIISYKKKKRKVAAAAVLGVVCGVCVENSAV